MAVKTVETAVTSDTQWVITETDEYQTQTGLTSRRTIIVTVGLCGTCALEERVRSNVSSLQGFVVSRVGDLRSLEIADASSRTTA
jgi:hypothetical protein